MNSRSGLKRCLAALVVALGINSGLDHSAAAPRQSETADEAQEGVQVLTRGPVHEAFAETVTFDPQPGIIVSNVPPEAIEELPPEHMPEGANVTWIPGYFAWDDEQDNFLWVSGIWRNLPPGRQWVPGYWAESAEGTQWISGYWGDAAQTEIQYLPEPPATVEVGPNIEAPSISHIWLPGCWVWHEDRYAWRPGYWEDMQPHWDWVPAHYARTPRGYVFVDGYYDHLIARRGVLFAPVFFDASVYSRRDYSYSPSTVIDLAHFTSHLFSRPRYNHYYFGDWYASDYTDAGYFPWYSYGSSGYGYDPFYARQRWDHREDGDWEHRLETDFQNRRDNEDARPPRTLADQIALNTNGGALDESFQVAVSLADLTTNQDSGQKFRVMDTAARQELAQHADAFRTFRQERQTLEAEAGTSAIDADKPSEPVKSLVSPIVASTDDSSGTEVTPPKIQNAPEIDLNVEPKARNARETEPTATTNKDDTTLNQKGKSKADARKDKPRTDLKDTPESDRPKGAPKADSPKDKPRTDLKDKSKSDRSKGDSKADAAKPQPKGGVKDTPKSDRPKADRPKDTPKADRKDKPKSEQPKGDALKGKSKSDVKSDPLPVPKVEPKPELPKVVPPPAPKVEPKPELPKVDPPPAPKVEPKPEVPKVDS